MRWSFRVGRIDGVWVEVHALFALTLLAAAAYGWVWLGGLLGAAYGVVIINLLFAGVLVHEVAHMKQAQRERVVVRRIVLMPLGGIAELSALPDDPRVELRIALAGPLANLALGLMFGGLTMVLLNLWPFNLTLVDVLMTATIPTFAGLLFFLTVTNLALAVVNMAPVFPLDGGRVLRSLLMLFLPSRLATNATAGLSGLAGLLLVVFALFGWSNWSFVSTVGLLLMASLLLAGTGQETLNLYMRRQLEQDRVAHSLEPTTWTISAADRIARLDGSSLFAQQAVLPVVSGTRLVGLLMQKHIRLAGNDPEKQFVVHVMETQFPRLPHDATLWEAHQALVAARLPALPVLKDGDLLGMVTQAGIRRRATRPDDDDPNPRLVPHG